MSADGGAYRFVEPISLAFVALGVGVKAVADAVLAGLWSSGVRLPGGNGATRVADMELVAEGFESVMDLGATAFSALDLASAHIRLRTAVITLDDDDRAFVANAESDAFGDALDHLGGGEIGVAADGALAPAANGAKHGVVGDTAVARDTESGVRNGRPRLLTEDALHPQRDRFVAIPERIHGKVNEVRLVLFEPV